MRGGRRSARLQRALVSLRPAVRPWLELLRLPNLLTVPGDPLAGGLLVAAAAGTTPPWGRLGCAAGSALFLYIAGLLVNDVVDLDIDRELRPERPLPRGAVHPPAAACAAVLSALAGLLLAAPAGRFAFGTAIFLVLLILAYSLYLKHDSRRAAIGMGLCRAASLVLGAAAIDTPGVFWPTVFAAGLYIAAVTWIAAHETGYFRAGREALLPGAALAGGFLYTVVASGFSRGGFPGLGSGLLSLAAAAACVLPALHLGLGLLHRFAAPQQLQKAIGGWIRLLLPWQAALVALSGHPGSSALAVTLLLLWPVHRLLSRHLAPS